MKIFVSTDEVVKLVAALIGLAAALIALLAALLRLMEPKRKSSSSGETWQRVECAVLELLAKFPDSVFLKNSNEEEGLVLADVFVESSFLKKSKNMYTFGI